MSRWLSAVAAGCAIALVGLVVVLALRPDATGPAERADALAAELRCPDCQGLSVADSPTAAAREIRRQIDELVAAGATDDAVREHFVARYGEWILLAPRAGIAWIVPFAVALVGVAVLALVMARRRSHSAPPVAPSDAERRRIHDEAEALDA
ncbi:MAG TPA: cytochrome c-type biogenesis protein CcmH [Candidatus Limnocylindria bacterium]|jgi:cytochrome c-type biogenesis protein CcmH